MSLRLLSLLKYLRLLLGRKQLLRCHWWSSSICLCWLWARVVLLRNRSEFHVHHLLARTWLLYVHCQLLRLDIHLLSSWNSLLVLIRLRSHRQLLRIQTRLLLGLRYLLIPHVLRIAVVKP